MIQGIFAGIVSIFRLVLSIAKTPTGFAILTSLIASLTGIVSNIMMAIGNFSLQLFSGIIEPVMSSVSGTNWRIADIINDIPEPVQLWFGYIGFRELFGMVVTFASAGFTIQMTGMVFRRVFGFR